MSIFVLIALVAAEFFAALAFLKICQHAEPDCRLMGGLLLLMIVCGFVAGGIFERVA